MSGYSARQVSCAGRIEYIDIAKAIGIFCVLLGHTVDSNTLIKTIVYAFHMPAFFMLSGFTLKSRNNINIGRLAWKKFKSLMIPYFIWGIIYMPFSFKNMLFMLYGTRETLLKAEALSSLWFLPTLFVASMIAEFVVSHVQKRVLHLIIAAACFAVGFMIPHYGKYGDFWSIDIAIVSAGFIFIGYLIRPVLEISCANTMVGVTEMVLSFILLFLGIRLNNPDTGYVLMANGIYGNPLLFLIGALSGSIIIIILAKVICHIPMKIERLLFFGRNSLGIFLVHKPFVELGRVIFSSAGLNYNNPIIAFVNALMCLCVSGGVVFLIDQYCPMLFMKKK